MKDLIIMHYNFFLFFIFIILGGCHNYENKKMIGMPNPASVYCEQLHGKSIIVNTPQGQYGNCILPSGETIEEWALYRRDHPLPK